MAPPRRYWVKLKVPKDLLIKLPKFEPPISKSRLKKIAAEEKRNVSLGIDSNWNSKTSSPQPETNYRINLGLKESSTSGLTMNSVSSTFVLDKSGKPSNKFVKRPRQFKTFSGFKIKYVTWKVKRERKEPLKDKPAKSNTETKEAIIKEESTNEDINEETKDMNEDIREGIKVETTDPQPGVIPHTVVLQNETQTTYHSI